MHDVYMSIEEKEQEYSPVSHDCLMHIIFVSIVTQTT